MASKNNLWFLVDCTSIFGHKVAYINSGHDGLFARFTPKSAFRTLRHTGYIRICKRRFDLFTISSSCFTIVGEFLLISQPAWVRIPEGTRASFQTQAGLPSGRKSISLVNKAHTTRALLLARATAAIFLLRRLHKFCIQRLRGFFLLSDAFSTALAP